MSAALQEALHAEQPPTAGPQQENALVETPFVHLHNHSQFSVLQATSRINQLVEATAKYNMPAVALTDHANLMGAFHCVKEIKKHNASLEENQRPIIPILGCEFYVCEDHQTAPAEMMAIKSCFWPKIKKGTTTSLNCRHWPIPKVFIMSPELIKNL